MNRITLHHAPACRLSSSALTLSLFAYTLERGCLVREVPALEDGCVLTSLSPRALRLTLSGTLSAENDAAALDTLLREGILCEVTINHLSFSELRLLEYHFAEDEALPRVKLLFLTESPPVLVKEEVERGT